MSATARRGSIHFDNTAIAAKLQTAGNKGAYAMPIRITEVRAFNAASNVSIVQYRAARSGAARLPGEKDRIAIGQRFVWAPHEIDSAPQRSKIPALALESGAFPTETSAPHSR